MIPCITNEAGVSPGWIRAEIKMYFIEGEIGNWND